MAAAEKDRRQVHPVKIESICMFKYEDGLISNKIDILVWRRD